MRENLMSANEQKYLAPERWNRIRDHRLIDGATAASFMNYIRAKLEDASFWKNML